MMVNLKRNDYFNGLKGLIFGEIRKLKDITPPFGEIVQEIILNTVSKYNFQVDFDFPTENWSDNCALILV